MPDSITIFKDPDGGRYYNVVIDGRIVDGLATDETLATVAAALLEGTYPPYAKRRTLQELREQEREAGEQHAQRMAARQDNLAIEPPLPAPPWVWRCEKPRVTTSTTNQGDTR